MIYYLLAEQFNPDRRTHPIVSIDNQIKNLPSGIFKFLSNLENFKYVNLKKDWKCISTAEHLTIILSFENSPKFMKSVFEVVSTRVQSKKKTKLIFDRSYENGLRTKDILKVRKLYIKLGLSNNDILFFLNSSYENLNTESNVFIVDLFAVVAYLKITKEDYPTSQTTFKDRPKKVNLLLGKVSKPPRFSVLEEFYNNELLQESLIGLLTTEKEITELLPKGNKDTRDFRNLLISKIGSLDGLQSYRSGRYFSSPGWSGNTYIYDNSNLSYVVETWAHVPVFHTEKIYRPIINRHPFVLMASEGSLASLKNKNFLTFSDIIDESYDAIEFVPDRIKKTVSQARIFLEKSEVNSDKIQEIVDHNYETFIKYADNEYQRAMKYLKDFLDKS